MRFGLNLILCVVGRMDKGEDGNDKILETRGKKIMESNLFF